MPQAYLSGVIVPDNGGGFGQSPTWQDVRRCVIRVEGQNGIEAEGRINVFWQVNMTVSSPDPAIMYHLTWECPSNVGLSLMPLDFQLFPLFTQTFSGVAVFTN